MRLSWECDIILSGVRVEEVKSIHQLMNASV